MQMNKSCLSKDAIGFIISHEVSSRAAYENKYESPIRPGGDSGITIGIGADLGYMSEQQFGHYFGHISQDSLNSLLKFIGLKGSDAEKAFNENKETLRKIKISYEEAEKAFREMIVKYEQKTQNIFPGCENEHAMVYGALVSLVYNRGGDISEKQTRKQMRNIHLVFKGEIELGQKQFRGKFIGDEIRKMKRLWEGKENLRGLLRRRDEEAELVEKYMK